jgi:hypothetical protein
MEMIISVVYVNAMYIPGIVNTVSSILRMRIRRLVPLDPVCARLALQIVHPEPLEPSALSSDHVSEIPNQFPGIPWESYLYLFVLKSITHSRDHENVHFCIHEPHVYTNSPLQYSHRQIHNDIFYRHLPE